MKQLRQLYLALRDLFEAMESSIDLDAKSIPLTPEVVSAYQQARTVVEKYKGSIT